MLLIKVKKRTKVNLKVQSAESSHSLENRTITNVQSNEKIVQATRVIGGSEENCVTQTYANGQVKQSCTCEKETYEYMDENNNRHMAICPKYHGKCRKSQNKNMIFDSRGSGHLKCATNKIKCNLTLHKLTAPDDDRTIECSYDASCPQINKVMQVPVRKIDGTISCPKSLWNTCQLKINYKGKEYEIEKQLGDNCAYCL